MCMQVLLLPMYCLHGCLPLYPKDESPLAQLTLGETSNVTCQLILSNQNLVNTVECCLHHWSYVSSGALLQDGLNVVSEARVAGEDLQGRHKKRKTKEERMKSVLEGDAHD